MERVHRLETAARSLTPGSVAGPYEAGTDWLERPAVREALDMRAAETVYACRALAAELFDAAPEQVIFTMNATHGLNIAIRTLVPQGGRVVISGFEHNAVTRPLHALDAHITVAGRRLFSPDEALAAFEEALAQGQDAAVCTQMSNVFGYVLPVMPIAALCTAFDTSDKIWERHRRYLIAAVLATDGNYPHIASYILPKEDFT